MDTGTIRISVYGVPLTEHEVVSKRLELIKKNKVYKIQLLLFLFATTFISYFLFSAFGVPIINKTPSWLAAVMVAFVSSVFIPRCKAREELNALSELFTPYHYDLVSGLCKRNSEINNYVDYVKKHGRTFLTLSELEQFQKFDSVRKQKSRLIDAKLNVLGADK